MEPFLIIVVPGLVGGAILAFLFVRFHGAPARVLPDERLAPPSTDLINMARIRVAGFGGLGMVAMSIVVAIFVPRIRLTMAIALVLGGVLAAVLIAQRRRQGPWNNQHPGAHCILPNEAGGQPVASPERLCRAALPGRGPCQELHSVLDGILRALTSRRKPTSPAVIQMAARRSGA